MNFLTRRLPTILGLLILVGIGWGLWGYIQNSRPIISESIRPQKVRVTNVADNKFSVSWITSEMSMGKIEYGGEGEKLSLVAGDDRGGVSELHTVHHVTIRDLQPNTSYTFRVISGQTGAKFDNNGSPYSVTTGKVIGATPVAKSFYGTVKDVGADGAIVYIALPNAEPVSTIVTTSGSYSIPVSTIRSGDGKSYVNYNEQTTVASVSVEDGNQSAVATILMSGVTPVPTITMGQDYDFRNNVAIEPEVAQVEPGTTPEPISILNVEPLQVASVGSAEITILNPGIDGEELATTLPEFRGLAPAGEDLSITLYAKVNYSDTALTDMDGTWEWTPPEELTDGQHEIMVSYIDSEGYEQKSSRSFFVSGSLAQSGDPAFESTPSSGVYASPSPSTMATESARVSNPSTESGVPVSGIIDHTLLTGALGIVIMVLGALTLAL
jgi:hypothetical protein